MSATTDETLEAATWDLEPLVERRGPEAVETMLTEARERAEAFAGRYRGRVAELEADELAEAMRELGAIHDLAGRAGSYAMLSFSLDTADPERGALMQKARELGAAIETQLLFFDLEWNLVDGRPRRRAAGGARSSASARTTCATCAATARTSSPSRRSGCSPRRT